MRGHFMSIYTRGYGLQKLQLLLRGGFCKFPALSRNSTVLVRDLPVVQHRFKPDIETVDLFNDGHQQF